MSGPLLDRIDLHVEVPAVTWQELTEARRGEPSRAVRGRVAEARARAARRLGGSPGTGVRSQSWAGAGGGTATGGARTNAEMWPEEIPERCRLDAEGTVLLKDAVERFGLSARGYHRVLRVARTIADLAGAERIGGDDLSEAIGYRVPEGKLTLRNRSGKSCGD